MNDTLKKLREAYEAWAREEADAIYVVEAVDRFLNARKSPRTDMGDGWQDIASAPKNGTWFLALQNGEIYPCQWGVKEYENSLGAITFDEGWYDLFNHSIEEPTEWRPLPAPPALRTGEATDV